MAPLWLTPRLLAHQGGWDEILFVAAPLLVLAALLGLANRRADAALKDGNDEADPDNGPAVDDDDDSG